MQAKRAINIIIVIVCLVCIMNILYMNNRDTRKNPVFKYGAKKELIKVSSDSTVIIFNNKTYILKP